MVETGCRDEIAGLAEAITNMNEILGVSVKSADQASKFAVIEDPGIAFLSQVVPQETLSTSSQIKKIAPVANIPVLRDSITDAGAEAGKNTSAPTDSGTSEKKHFSEKRDNEAIIYDFGLFTQKPA